jgi:hypothetical protein
VRRAKGTVPLIHVLERAPVDDKLDVGTWKIRDYPHFAGDVVVHFLLPHGCKVPAVVEETRPLFAAEHGQVLVLDPCLLLQRKRRRVRQLLRRQVLFVRNVPHCADGGRHTGFAPRHGVFNHAERLSCAAESCLPPRFVARPALGST